MAQSAEWSKLFNCYYRKRDLYELNWDVDLTGHRVIGAPFGGPLAIVRDTAVIARLNTLNEEIRIYSSSGRKLSQFPWKHGQIVGIGWTEDERLVCVDENGTVYLFNIHGSSVGQFSLGQTARDELISECYIWGQGMVARTELQSLVYITGFSDPTPKILQERVTSAPPTCMMVIEPHLSETQEPEVILATQDGGITLATINNVVVNSSISNGPFYHMALSPNGKIVGCFTQSRKVWVFASDFRKNYLEFDVKSPDLPSQLVWCGVDSVVLRWDKLVLMVGPQSDWITYEFDEPIWIVPECDGVRIVSNDTMSFLHRVPDPTVDIFEIGSTKPAAMLYDAMQELFERKSAKADENLRSISDRLPEAVEACIQAAAHEFDTETQRLLLQAASYGKCFCEAFDSEHFTAMCKTLRVLNNIRDPSVGIPLTYTQYTRLTPSVVVDRLLNRNHHLLASKVCEYLSLDVERVLVHWACEKIRRGARYLDKQLCDMIVTQLATHPSISYVEIARTAHKLGRKVLAMQLLEYEPRAAEQVPLLLSMQNVERALDKAMESGDTDLAHFVFLHLRNTRTMDDICPILKPRPAACALFLSHNRALNTDSSLSATQTVYGHLGQFNDQAAVNIIRAYKQPTIERAIPLLSWAKKQYEQNNFAFHAKSVEDEVKFLKFYSELQKACPEISVLGTSVSELLHTLIVNDQPKKAKKVIELFKVPDKRYYWINIKALAEKGDWHALLAFSHEKKSPIGYSPFAEVCLNKNQTGEAAKYIGRVTDPAQKAILHARVGEWESAVEAAFVARDEAIVNDVINMASKDILGKRIVQETIQRLQAAQ